MYETLYIVLQSQVSHLPLICEFLTQMPHALSCSCGNIYSKINFFSVITSENGVNWMQLFLKLSDLLIILCLKRRCSDGLEGASAIK